jgi:Spy/CpxP family protein refolding chaperone
MKKLMTLVAAIALAAMMVTPAAAWKDGMRGGYGQGGYYAEDITSAPGLNLTAEQVAKLNALREAHLRDIKPLQDQSYSKRGELRLLWLERTPDQNKIMAAQKEYQTVRDKLYEKGTIFRLETTKVLTPEQQAQVQIQSYRPGRGYAYGKGMRGHGGMDMAPGMGRGMSMRGY